MALTKCKECGKEISTDAKTCPHCGKEIKKSSIWTKKFSGCGCLAVILLIIIVYAVIRVSTSTSRSPKAPTSQVRRPSVQELQVQFDIPQLLKMNIADVKKTLGKPVSEFIPTQTQYQLDPNFASSAEYEKGTTNLQIDYSRNGKVISIFISDNTTGRTKAEIMKLGNLQLGSSEYTIRVQNWLNPTKARQMGSAEIAGIEVKPR